MSVRGLDIPTYNTADDVGHVHEMIVNDIGKVVRGIPVRLEQDEVTVVLVLLVMAVDDVGEGRTTAFRATEAYNVALAIGGAASSLVRRYRTAGTGVVDGVGAAVEGLLLVALELLGGAEAAIGVAGVDEAVRVSRVVVKALGLFSGVRPHVFRGCIFHSHSPGCKDRKARQRQGPHPSRVRPISDR